MRVLPSPRDNKLCHNWLIYTRTTFLHKALFSSCSGTKSTLSLAPVPPQSLLSFVPEALLPASQKDRPLWANSFLPLAPANPPPTAFPEGESLAFFGAFSSISQPLHSSVKFVSGFSQDDQLKKASLGLLAPPFPLPARVSLGSMGSSSFVLLRRTWLMDCLTTLVGTWGGSHWASSLSEIAWLDMEYSTESGSRSPATLE